MSCLDFFSILAEIHILVFDFIIVLCLIANLGDLDVKSCFIRRCIVIILISIVIILKHIFFAESFLTLYFLLFAIVSVGGIKEIYTLNNQKKE